MSWEQEAVEEFHIATGSTVGTSIEMRDRELRAKLIMEEACETIAAMGFEVEASIWYPLDEYDGDLLLNVEYDAKQDIDGAIDGLCDLLYVTYGTAVAWGVRIDPFFDEVHRANMTKLAGEKREDGKQLKPEGWVPPRIKELREAQQHEDEAWARAGNAGLANVEEVIG